MARARRGRGEGSIYQLPNGTYRAAVSAGYNGEGKRRRKIVSGKTKAEVQSKLRAVQTRGVGDEPGKMTVAAWLKHWLEGPAKSTAGTATLTRYEQLARLYVSPYIGGMRMDKLRLLHIDTMLVDLERDKVSVSNRSKAVTMLSTAMRAAVRKRLIDFNPVRDASKPRVERKEMLTWDEKQTDAFLKAAVGDRLHALYVLALSSGMRSGEMLGLEWSDIDFGGRSIQVQRSLEELNGTTRLKNTKSAKGRRRVDLPQFCIDALQQHRKNMLAEGHASGPVFCDTDGGYLLRPNLSRRSYRPILVKAAVPAIRFHDLRHTHATLLLLKGVHPKIVSERLGHATIEITLNTYSHVLPTLQREAADKMERLFG